MIHKSSDIHNHLLPGVDDGFGTKEESLEAVRILCEAGVKELVFTPHINPDVYPDGNEAKMRQVYEEFQPLLQRTCIHYLNWTEFFQATLPCC